MPLISSEEHELLDGSIFLSTPKVHIPHQESIKRMSIIGTWSLQHEPNLPHTWWINILNDLFDRLRKENVISR